MEVLAMIFYKKIKKKQDITLRYHYSLMFLSLFIAISLIIPTASAADPGHGAAVIGAGTFESGNYVFPNNFTVGSSNAFFVNNNTMRIGIGTTAPTRLLDVRGIINASGEIYVQNFSAVSPWLYNQTGFSTTFNSSYAAFAYNHTSAANTSIVTTYSGQWYNHTSAANTSIFTTYDGRWSSTYNASYEGFAYNQSNLNFSSSVFFLRDTASRVSIGGTTSNYKLDVTGNVSLNSTLYVATNSRVGIGTETPTTTLQVVGNISATDTVNTTKVCISGDCQTAWPAGGGGGGPWSNASNVAYLNTTTDRVSIGALTSSYKLDVLGNVSLNSTLYVATNSRVGIGTAVPTAALHVVANDSSTSGLTLAAAFEHYGVNGTANGTNGSAVGILFRATDSLAQLENISLIVANLTNATSGGEAGALQFYTRTGGGNLTERVRIGQLGRVGINTTAPTHVLNVVGTGNITGTAYLAENFLVNTSSISFGGETARLIFMDRRVAADNAGNSLTIEAGGAGASGSNSAGGQLILRSGLSTGSGASSILLQTYNDTSSVDPIGDSVAVTRVTINNNGAVGIGRGTFAGVLSSGLGELDVAYGGVPATIVISAGENFKKRSNGG